MVLMPFSISEQIPLLLSGQKCQTTRKPSSVRIGDVLHCWHVTEEGNLKSYQEFIGTSTVTSVLRLRDSDRIPEYEMGSYGKLFGHQTEAWMETWACKDGFVNLQEAHKWFTEYTGSDQWMFQEWDIIMFKPDWGKK